MSKKRARAAGGYNKKGGHHKVRHHHKLDNHHGDGSAGAYVDGDLVDTSGFRPGGFWHNPGRDEAIAALVLAFLFPVLGFILALLSVNRSRRFGWPAEAMAKGALWASVLTTVLGIVSFWWLRAHIGYGGYFPVLRNLWWV